ncbi:type VI secretion system-associated protein TagO [Halomonas sp. PAMB 3232]|uniref:type VI secretion system-associated protein TagO n=1 Tax=Halomonas sp. PAMB 3232 TaxID=3075221 RepID=UPI00289ED327|nr:type VI secretion system-associated protein TagO [Halomonas sp. PAMB 3232]WNL39843.1 type VI secretion system-associated protein TagO [Halomonas sp. PAMB 3232]
MKTAKSTVAAAIVFFIGQAHAAEDCVDISNDDRRLACYDAEYQPSSDVTQESDWMVNSETSPIDDSTAVYLRVFSKEPVTDRIGRQGDAELWIRCSENTTAMIMKFAGNHMADLNQYGQVTLRIDDLQARTMRMDASTDHSSLGLWSGGRSIPVIRSMFDHDTLTVRATPYSQSPITTQFPITGLEEAIEPLREACNW